MSKQFIATRDFKDSGTGQEFTEGQTVDADRGDIGNYLAAGLVREEKVDKAASEAAKSDEPPAAQPARKRTATKRATTKSSAAKLN